MGINLNNFTVEQLCEIESILSGWEWDERLGKRPKGWYRIPKYYRDPFRERFFQTRFKINYPIVQQIEKRIGKKKILEYHWMHNLGRTKEEFENWYEIQVANRVLF